MENVINFADIAKLQKEEYEIIAELLRDKIIDMEKDLDMQNVFRYISIKSLYGKVDAVIKVANTRGNVIERH